MPSKTITSVSNSQIKKIVRMRKHKERIASGLTIVEGVREIEKAVKTDIDFEEVYVCKEFLGKRKVPKKIGIITEITQEVYEKISYGERSEGILAVIKTPRHTLKDFSAKTSLFIVVESVEKPGNLGAILRTADGAGVDGVIVCDAKTDIYNPNVIRSSLGTIFSVTCVMASNEETLEFLKSKNTKICATFPDADTVYTSVDLKGCVAIVLGSEETGLTSFWKGHSDIKVKIPMQGAADSLNVSVTTAILLYEIIRQRST